jgi:hypothetical protein
VYEIHGLEASDAWERSVEMPWLQLQQKGGFQPKTNYDSVSSTKSDDVGVRPDIFVMRLSSYS